VSYLFKNIPKARHDHSWWPGALDTLSSSHVRQAELLIDAAASQPALSGGYEIDTAEANIMQEETEDSL
jgi:hypothetical protein